MRVHFIHPGAFAQVRREYEAVLRDLEERVTASGVDEAWAARKDPGLIEGEFRVVRTEPL